ncbi:hypothetical protein LOTGIDRAFT_236961 [Lottia gigantea]|uniref:LRRCT domain-containing protein n=1 Tax=Lottia gigantea TaxID=225164 RepID=V4B2C4_LOTGI|nr:hypothetical protein LOTGIDRAFT_236961 [Lottia gigantea]ESO82469.1 hypothetical protein LOTGIDRAFT_236961 [Lottia gigantea]
MKIHELPCLLSMLLLVFVGQVHHMKVVVCPRECSRDEETLTCNGITNDALPNLYKCVNVFPDIQVIDIRSSITCDCSLLYLTNHHVNPNLLVFAPVTCPQDTVAACGFDHSKKKSDMVEIAGKMFEIQDEDLPNKVDKHVEDLVKKLGQVLNSKKRLQYIHAIFLSTKEAIGKLTHLQDSLSQVSTSSSPATTSTPTSTQGVQIPRYPSNSNPFFSIYKKPHLLSSKTVGYVQQPHNHQEAYPFQVHVFHHGPANDDKVQLKLPFNQPTQTTTLQNPTPTARSWSYDRSYVHQPHHRTDVVPIQVNIPYHTSSDTESIGNPESTTHRTTSTVQSTTGTSHSVLTRKRPHIAPHRPPFGAPSGPFMPYYGKRLLPGYRRPNGHHKRILASEEASWYKNPYYYNPEGLWNLARTSTAATTTESLAEEIRENDTRMKLIIFGSIIAFIVLVITIILVIINGGKGTDNSKHQHGDLDLESFKQTITLWKKLKGKMQVDYRRRETTGKHTTPSRKTSRALKETEIIKQSLQNMPQTNLLQTAGNDAAAVSGLTTAITQQPALQHTTPKSERQIDKLHKMKPTRPIGPDGFQTRLIYRDHNHHTRNLATVALAVMDKSKSKNAQQIQPSSSSDSSSSSTKNPEVTDSQLPTSKKSEPGQQVNNTDKEEQRNVAPESSEEGLFASNLMKKDVEPTKPPVDQPLKSKIFVDKTFGTPTSTDGQSDNFGARKAVKTFQPKSQELGRGGRLMGVGDNKYFEVTCTFMDFQERERSRAVRKKKLARAQFLA